MHIYNQLLNAVVAVDGATWKKDAEGGGLFKKVAVIVTYIHSCVCLVPHNNNNSEGIYILKKGSK